MFGYITYIKIAIAAVSLLAITGAYVYVKNLKANLAISEANNAKLESAVNSQKKVIDQQVKDIQSIRSIMKDQQDLNKKLDKSIKDLSDKFQKLKIN